MLRPMPIEPIPTEPARVARAAFPKGHRYLRVADELESLFTDEVFLALFPPHGQPALPRWGLALVTILHGGVRCPPSPSCAACGCKMICGTAASSSGARRITFPRAARFISSPSDAEAHDARKHTTPWVGYTVHLTETCEDELPHLITHIETTPGPASDGAATPKIHAALEQRGLLPGTHIVDTGFLDADLFVKSWDDDGVDLLGPT